ncbi:hypothetical protein J3D48_006164 [Pseudomonas fluorescens]|uniref:Ig-like domain-containing protein n=1 Tax=Pseudomonas fluorescens TaxID=294 RepID=UPI00209F9E18|nr:Ig-like domain-containing protein [Pseudomonas fluorescens]MCP1489754.1 hypothetical protein [Pseudomonas fluorescens]
MTATLRYLITSSQNREVLDFRAIGAKYTLDGVEYDYSVKGDAAITGNALPNTIWDAPGLSVDARQLLGGTDVVLFGGQWSDYSKALNAVDGTITFSRTVDGKVEQVTVANGQLALQQDLLVFADGSVRTDTARKALINQGVSASVDDLKAIGTATVSNTADDWNANITSSHPGALLPESPGGNVRGIASAAASFALPTVGVSQVLTGSAGVDQVYITPGATMDARQLLGGEDQIFFTGKWADYTKSLDSVAGTITLTRMVEGKTETAIVGNGQIALTRDLLVFADGAVRTDTARLALTQNPMASVEDLKAQGALTTSTAADDWKTDTFTRWGVKAPLIDKVSSDDKVDASEKQAGVVVSGSAEANSKVELEWGGVQKSVNADADGKWSATFASTEVPSDGMKVLSVTAADSSGYVSAPTTRDVVVDTVAPVAPVVQPIGGDGIINGQEKNNGVTIAGSAEPGSTVTVDLGGIEKTVPVDNEGNWQVQYPKDDIPSDGNSAVKVIVTDPAGNTTSEDVPLVIKTIATAPVINSVTNDNIVNNAEKVAGVKVTGTAEVGSSVRVMWGSTEHTVTADVDGKWASTFALIEIPTNGTSPISAVATDVASNVSLPSTLDVKVDTVVSIPMINPVDINNTVNAIEKQDGVNVTGTAEAGSAVAVTWGTAVHSVTAGADGAWSSTFVGNEIPADGNTSISAVATDVALNVSTPGTLAVKVDTVIADPVINAVAINNMVNRAEKEAGVIVTGTAEAGSAVRVTWGSIDHIVTVNAGGKWSATFAKAEIPDDGDTSISATATDVAGNVSTSSSQAVTVDTVLAAPTIDPISADDIVNGAELATGVIVTGTAEAGSSVYVQWSQEEHNVTANADGKWSVSLDKTTSSVVADVIVQARDAAGNVSTVVSRALTTDISVAEPVINGVAIDDIVNAIEKQDGVTVTGTAEAGSAVNVSWGNTEHAVKADDQGAWSSTFASAEILTDGYSAITAIATDVAGNVSTVSSQAVKVDTVVDAPVINEVAIDDIVNAIEKQDGVTVTGTAEAGSAVNVNWGNTKHAVKADDQGAWSSTFATADIPADGPTQISAVATDVAGNVSTKATRDVTVDTVVPAPVITYMGCSDQSEFALFPGNNDQYISGLEKNMGFTVKGTAEAGNSVEVKLGDATHQVVVQNDGTWATVFNNSEVPTEGGTVLRAVVTDKAGNTSSAKRDLIVDTVLPLSATIDPITGDNVINAKEKADGLTVTGTAEANFQVQIQLSDDDKLTKAKYVTADSTGHWSVHFTSAEVPEDTNKVSARAVDEAFNIQQKFTEQTFTYDTEVAAPSINAVIAGNIVNAIEKQDGVNVTGTAEAGSAVAVTWGTAVHSVTAGADGAWSSTFVGNEIPADGNTSISAVATDVALNVSTPGTLAVKVDTVVAVPVINTVAGDDVVSADEQATGVTVTGTAEVGSAVNVVWDSVNHTVTADADGKWSANFTKAEVPDNGSHAISATATDVAGNISTPQTHMVNVEVNPVLSSDVAGASNFDVRSDIVVKSSLAGHLADGIWTIKVVNDANDATHDGYRGENQDSTQSLTFSVANGVVTDLSGGHVHMSADGKSIVLDPTFDLDLGNKYHIEAAAGMFKTDSGGVSDAFNGANFATVSPGAYNAADAHQGGVLAQKFDDSGALVDSQHWVDITGNGRFYGAQTSINAGDGDYAFVVKDLCGDAPDAETSAAGDGVTIDGDLNVLLTNFGKDDLLYIDQQDNHAYQNDMTQSTFQAGDGHAKPLEYVGGAGGSAQDSVAKVDIQLESGLTVSEFSLNKVASDIHSNTGVVISG